MKNYKKNSILTDTQIATKASNMKNSYSSQYHKNMVKMREQEEVAKSRSFANKGQI